MTRSTAYSEARAKAVAEGALALSVDQRDVLIGELLALRPTVLTRVWHGVAAFLLGTIDAEGTRLLLHATDGDDTPEAVMLMAHATSARIHVLSRIDALSPGVRQRLADELLLVTGWWAQLATAVAYAAIPPTRQTT